MNRNVLKIAIVSPVLLAVMACSSAPAPEPEQTAESPNKGRYSILQDRAPTRIVDLSVIPEVIP